MKKPPPLSARQVFARNLRLARRIREISQEELALAAGMSRSYVSGIERGERNVSIDNMGVLAEALDMTLKELVDPDLYAQVDKR